MHNLTMGSVHIIYLKPKVALHYYYIHLFYVLVGDILKVFNSY